MPRKTQATSVYGVYLRKIANGWTGTIRGRHYRFLKGKAGLWSVATSQPSRTVKLCKDRRTLSNAVRCALFETPLTPHGR